MSSSSGCVPESDAMACANANADCGQVTNNCGMTVNCPTCTAAPPCGNTGTCTNHKCEKAANGTTCGAATCNVSTFTDVSKCDGSGNCNASTPGACLNNFICEDATKCKAGKCGADSDCIPGAFCNMSGDCQSDLASGTDCSSVCKQAGCKPCSGDKV